MSNYQRPSSLIWIDSISNSFWILILSSYILPLFQFFLPILISKLSLPYSSLKTGRTRSLSCRKPAFHRRLYSMVFNWTPLPFIYHNFGVGRTNIPEGREEAPTYSYGQWLGRSSVLDFLHWSSSAFLTTRPRKKIYMKAKSRGKYLKGDFPKRKKV